MKQYAIVFNLMKLQVLICWGKSHNPID